MLLKIGKITFLDLIHKEKLLTYEQLVAKTGQLINQKQFELVKMLLCKLRDKKLLRIEMSKMNSFLTSGAIFKKSLFQINKLLIQSDKAKTDSGVKWEQDFQCNIPEAEWDCTNKYIIYLLFI